MSKGRQYTRFSYHCTDKKEDNQAVFSRPENQHIPAKSRLSIWGEKPLVHLGNTQFMDKYLFGGTVTQGTKPFGYDGTAVTYQGNTDSMIRKVGPDTFLDINTVGPEFQEIFSASIASTVLPVIRISAALALPTILGRR